MKPLKLLAFDPDDLSILSAHVQDSVLKVGNIDWHPRTGRFTLLLNRFAWEDCGNTGDDGQLGRCLAALSFARVARVESSRIRRDASEAVLGLMAVAFQPGDPPGGRIVLTFSGGGAIRLDVECIEAEISDLSEAWATASKPHHDLGGSQQDQ